MSVSILETPPSAPRSAPPRKIWTRGECERLRDTGVLDYEHLELIDGELIQTMGKGRPHSYSILLLREFLVAAFGALFVQQETPIDVSPIDNPVNEPEPDLAVISCPYTHYPTGNPPASDVRLVVEISHTTLTFDRTVKAQLYARAGIPEYWIVDLEGRRLLVHREPREGQYRSVLAFGGDEHVSPLAAPGSGLAVKDALPPKQ